MQRLLNALRNSARAFAHLATTERAFQQELVLLAAAVPAAWYVAQSWRGFAVLVGVLLLVLLVEALNTGLEAACDALSRDFNADIQLAKDCGSLAVLIAIVIALGAWSLAVAERFWGLAV